MIAAFRKKHWGRPCRSNCDHFNRARPHQGIGPRIPDEPPELEAAGGFGSVEEISVLGGLPDEYRMAA